MIEKMKFLSITGPKADIDRVVNTYLSKYEIHLENALSELTTVQNLTPFLEINPYKEALNTANLFCEELNSFAADTVKAETAQAAAQTMDVETALDTIRRIQTDYQDLDKKRSDLENQLTTVDESLRVIRPFRNLDFDISSILKFRFIRFRFGRIGKEYYQKFERYIYDNLDTIFIKCDEDDQYIWGMYFVPEPESQKVKAVYSSMHFEKIYMPDSYEGTAREAFEQLAQKRSLILSDFNTVSQKRNDFLISHCREILAAQAAIARLSGNFDIRKLAALRAAFKEVQESRQVAYLAPTTILAQQIYNTFVQRMKEFPVRVELLCRFRTPAQQKKAIEDLKKGQVDVVIGTHRILSKDVKFKNLGLLIVDEEQRFGVTHKEKIKQLKKDVDVLTLTATPIPRTLHMSLIGIRDMSVLEEPPMDRMPIQTYVMEYDEETVREAINRELRRGGQVYYVYNRVTDIADVALRIAKLVPEARVDFAHGQMSERELENVMYGFVNGDIDVLVSTTIIETGLDISNVNTMIIHDSDRYGLSQLYQLRGRIGRSNRTAYAFLMYRKNMMLKETAEKRLAAIREYTDLGSGFKIAMRDLELRGAGNLLGAQQHGHMNAVGYDLYCKMLSEAVKEAKGIHTMEDFDTSIDLNVDAYIPDTYIGNEFQKLDIYKRIAGIENQQDYDDMLEELLDRFGEPGKAVLNLLAVARLKSIAHRGYVTEIKQLGKEVRVTLYERAKLNPAGIPLLMQKYGRSLQFKNDQEPKFILNLRDPLIQALTEFAGELEKLAE